MKENIRKIEEYIELVLNKGYCECNELNEIIGKHCDGSKNVAYAIDDILSDYKRVLKENEELKAENNKLKVIKYDTNYGTETINLMPKSELVKISTNRCMIEIENGKFVDLKQVYQENEKLKEKWDKDTHKLQNDLDIANAEIIELKADNYELNNSINDLLDSIPTQKVKDKLEKYKKISNELYIKFLESDRYDTNIRDKGIKCDAVVQVLQELLEEE